MQYSHLNTPVFLQYSFLQGSSWIFCAKMKIPSIFHLKAKLQMKRYLCIYAIHEECDVN